MVGAIIQARMGSTRLPKKTLADVAGKPLLWHVIDRLKRSGKIEKIVIATTVNSEDQQIEDFCAESSLDCFRGSSDNVLSRFIQAAEKYGISTVVRICADSPLMDIQTIDDMIEMLIDENADIVTISPDKTSLLDGFEITTLPFLKKLESLASKPCHFEHVTYLGKEDPSLGKVLFYDPPQNLCHKDIRITVDTPQDLEFIREVYKWLYEEGRIIDVRRLEKLPYYLFRINEDIRQKPAAKETLKVQLVGDEKDPKIQEIKAVLNLSGYIDAKIYREPESMKSKNEIVLKRI